MSVLKCGVWEIKLGLYVGHILLTCQTYADKWALITLPKMKLLEDPKIEQIRIVSGFYNDVSWYGNSRKFVLKQVKFFFI